MNTVFVVLIIFCIGAVAFIGYDYFFKRKKPNRVRILLFEQVGNDKKFSGNFIGRFETDKSLGDYIFIEKVGKAISDVGAKDYFFDAQYGKCLLVCKFASDDYRIMSRMDKGITGEIKVIQDKEGKEVEEFVPYIEPMGVNQDSRSASRFNRAWHKKMEEARKDKKDFWDKYGSAISIAFIGMILLIGIVYITNKHTSLMKNGLESFSEGAFEYKKAVEDPSWVDNLMDAIHREEMEENTPPSAGGG